MKKLNKKGFTLVELLAVIVILALLIVVVATTALPAMNNAKKSALDTYSKKVIEQAKTLYTTECVLATNTTKCKSDYTWSLSEIMGSDVSDQYAAGLQISKSGDVIVVSGAVNDTKNGLTSTIGTSKVTGTDATTAADCAKLKEDNCFGSCKWTAGANGAAGSCGLSS